MKVFKFGGASVKDAESIKQVANIIQKYQSEKLIVVISAMGKTTNALEKIVYAMFENKNDSSKLLDLLNDVKKYHFNILNKLFNNPNELIYKRIENYFLQLFRYITKNNIADFDYEYDQIVSTGELLSTEIISYYLNILNIKNKLLDIRNYLSTDKNYRDAKINWKTTQTNFKKIVKQNLIITQGFIGGHKDTTTTLGREGSDYTAAIIAYCLDADEVIIWKDVEGLLNADPKFFKNTVKLNKITYQEAIELAYYGATIIHPKTIKPLENKNIPLRIKSFLNPENEGSLIHNFNNLEINVPCYIFKTEQILISISPRDLSFIAEHNLATIFSIFAKNKIKINLMQNSAVSFSICIDNDNEKLNKVLDSLRKENFKVKYNEHLTLITIRHYNEDIINFITQNKAKLLEQKSRSTVQLIVKE
jgi:aspartate kinase